MPRKPVMTVNEIYEGLKSLNFIRDGNQLPEFTDDIWKTASKMLGGKLCYKYLYLYFTKNRNGLLQKFDENYEENTKADEGDSTKEASFESNWSMNSFICDLPPLRTEMNIGKKTWKEIEPQVVSYKERDYANLQPGWTNIIYKHLWDQFKLPCAFNFKNAKVNEPENAIWISITAHCPECGSHLNLYSIKGPTETGMHFYISTNDTRGIVHTKKRQIKGVERECVAKDLDGVSTYTWRRQKAEELMDFGDVEPAHLYNEGTLRKVRQQARDKKLGVTKETDPVAALLRMRYEVEYAGIIKEIGIDKFFCHVLEPGTNCHVQNVPQN